MTKRGSLFYDKHYDFFNLNANISGVVNNIKYSQFNNNFNDHIDIIVCN